MKIRKITEGKEIIDADENRTTKPRLDLELEMIFFLIKSLQDKLSRRTFSILCPALQNKSSTNERKRNRSNDCEKKSKRVERNR